MGNVVGSSFQEFVDMLTDAVSRPGPWAAVVVVIVLVVVAAALRSKVSASWVWIPALSGALYFAVHRWLQLR